MTYDQLKNQLIENFESDTDVTLLDIQESIEKEYELFSLSSNFFDRDIYIDDLEGTEDIGDCDAIVDFQIKTTIPPMHAVVLKFAQNQKGQKVLLKYQFRYRYVVLLKLPIDFWLPKILKIMRTIFWINKCRNKYAEVMEKRFAKLRFANQIKYWNDLFVISEQANKRYTQELEDWLNTQLTMDQKMAQSNAYELFWDGTPHEQRHFTINYF